MILSAEEFVSLRESSNPNDYTRAAQEEATLDVWKDVISKYPNMKQWVIHNKTVPIEILEILVNDPDPNIRSFIAEKRKITYEIQFQLVHDIDEGVRARLLHNKNLDKGIGEILQRDKSKFIQKLLRECKH